MIGSINWYPGHMKKTRKLIQEHLKLVDAVVEVIDARIPISSRNPIIDDLVKNKKRIILLNKSDLSDAEANRAWERHFREQGNLTLATNCVSGSGASRLLKLLAKLQEEKSRGQAIKKPYRLMIAGVPNVGKSSLINRLTGKKSAQTGNKPGVTKGKQWLNLPGNMQLLDTPGILWPKFEDPTTGRNLAFCGSIKDEILDAADLALELIAVLQQDYSQLLAQRYKLEAVPETPLETMEAMALKRGCVLPGKKIDYDRIARVALDEFRSGMIGKITLEKPNHEQAGTGAASAAAACGDETF